MEKLLFGLLFLILASSAFALDNRTDIYEENKTDIFLEKTVSENDLEIIVEIVTPKELDIDEVRKDNLNVNFLGTEVVFKETTTSDLVKDNLNKLKSQGGYEKLISALKGLNSRTMNGLTFETSLVVFEITPIYVNAALHAYRTKKTMIFKADQDYKKISVIELISENIASNLTQFKFLNKSPGMLQKVPLALFWEFKDVKENDTIQITYFVKNLVIGDEGNVLMTIGEPTNPREILDSETKSANFFKSEIVAKTFGINWFKRVDFANSLAFLSIIAVIVLVGGSVLFEMDARNSFEGIKNICRDAEACVRVGVGNRATIDRYVLDCLAKGHKMEDIRKNLLKAGWDKKAVRRILDKHR